MNKSFALVLLILGAVSFACKNFNQTAVNSNVPANSSPTTTASPTDKTETNTAMPPTEKANSGDYVESESGTEKAKPDAGKANIQGKVLFNGQPVEGVEVKVCEKFSQFIGGCSGEIFKTKTDANGEYLLTQVTPKEYESLMVQVFKTKNYIFSAGNFGISAEKYKFDADKTFFAPETNLFKDDLKIIAPKAAAKVPAQNLEIKWDAYQDAKYYKVDLSFNETEYKSIYSNKKVEGTSLTVEETLDAGKYNLKISAYNANDVKLADSDSTLEFTVTGGAAANTAVK